MVDLILTFVSVLRHSAYAEIVLEHSSFTDATLFSQVLAPIRPWSLDGIIPREELLQSILFALGHGAWLLLLQRQSCSRPPFDDDDRFSLALIFACHLA